MITRSLFALSVLTRDAMLQGWLGNKDTVLHSGEGVVSIARWAGKFVAWANDRGVKVICSPQLMCFGMLLSAVMHLLVADPCFACS